MTNDTKPTLTLLPQYAETEVLKPGARVGKGGNPHHYLVNGVPYKRVTSILSDTIPKPGLIYWSRNVALEKAKTELTHALMMADPVEMNNEPYIKGVFGHEWINEVIEAARNRPDEVKNEAADWGTGAHNMIQRYIDLTMAGNFVYDAGPQYQDTLNAFKAFEEQFNLTWLATEMTVWSNTLQVAGTVDAIGRTSQGGLVVFDWKTSHAFYPEMALQVSAYASMLEEMIGESVVKAYVVRFPKEQPEMVNQIEPCKEAVPLTPLFEVKEIASITHGWTRYKELVPQARYLKSKVWVE